MKQYHFFLYKHTSKGLDLVLLEGLPSQSIYAKSEKEAASRCFCLMTSEEDSFNMIESASSSKRYYANTVY